MHLKAMSIPSFLPPISHQLFPCSRAVMTFNIQWCCPCIISVHHHGLCTLYKSVGNCCLGLFSPDTQWQRVQGHTWIKGVTSKPSSGSEHCGTLLLGSPSPWMLWFRQLMLSITFCVSHKPQPVHTQAVFSLLVIVCMLGSKAPHQK